MNILIFLSLIKKFYPDADFEFISLLKGRYAVRFISKNPITPSHVTALEEAYLDHYASSQVKTMEMMPGNAKELFYHHKFYNYSQLIPFGNATTIVHKVNDTPYIIPYCLEESESGAKKYIRVVNQKTETFEDERAVLQMNTFECVFSETRSTLKSDVKDLAIKDSQNHESTLESLNFLMQCNGVSYLTSKGTAYFEQFKKNFLKKLERTGIERITTDSEHDVELKEYLEIQKNSDFRDDTKESYGLFNWSGDGVFGCCPVTQFQNIEKCIEEICLEYDLVVNKEKNSLEVNDIYGCGHGILHMKKTSDLEYRGWVVCSLFSMFAAIVESKKGQDKVIDVPVEVTFLNECKSLYSELEKDGRISNASFDVKTVFHRKEWERKKLKKEKKAIPFKTYLVVNRNEVVISSSNEQIITTTFDKCVDMLIKDGNKRLEC